MYFMYDENGSPIGMNYLGEDYYYEKNLQGDIVSIVDKNGNAKVFYVYDAYGKIEGILDYTDNGEGSPRVGTANPFRYRGYYYDNESGFYYLQSRYYDPVTGRFLNADGTLNSGTHFTGFNLFAYCWNNPVNMVDFTGAAPSKLPDAIVLKLINLCLAPGVYIGLKNAFYNAGIAYLNYMGYYTAEAMYKHAFKGYGKDLSNTDKNKIIKNAKASQYLMNKVSKQISNARLKSKDTFDSYDIEIEFKSGDLFYAIQNAEIRIWGRRVSRNKWCIDIMMWDLYDFDELRVVSVSYTHLDVYKRQDIYHGGYVRTDKDILWFRLSAENNE